MGLVYVWKTDAKQAGHTHIWAEGTLWNDLRQVSTLGWPTWRSSSAASWALLQQQVILFLSLYLLYVVEQFGITLFCLYSAQVFSCFVVCNEPLCWFYLNCYVWLWSLWYPVLPFCLMNLKGEKNSLVQVLQLIFTEVADMIHMLKSTGTSILNLFFLPWHLCIFFLVYSTVQIWSWSFFKAVQSKGNLSPSNRGRLLKLEEASSLPRLDVCLMKKIAWVLWRL